jgi:hypothetical protein
MGTDQLFKALNEKDVENLYRHNFMIKLKDIEITSPFGCDGFGVSKSAKLRVLMEFKDDINLSNKTNLVKVLAQMLYYVKRFYDSGTPPPSTLFIADRNECATLHVNDLMKYLEMDIDWSLPPSSAHTVTELILSMMSDDNLKPFIFKSEDFFQCLDKVKNLTQNVQRKVLVTDKNITEVFQYFDGKVLGNNNLTTNERANLFVQILVNKDENDLVGSSKIKKIHTKSFGLIPIISRESFTSFFDHFSSSYSPSQKHKLAAVVDRIVEDVTRRKQGEFFTPSIWVDKAHEYIASVYGENWKTEYVVWDPAWGTGNLTRDYSFKELYVSTLNQSDIDTANQMGYNPEAFKFQYDFLNDDYNKLPKGLRDAIQEGRQIIVLMNPPYMETSDKSGEVSISVVAKQMNDLELGDPSSQQFNQFIFRLSNLSDKIDICQFTKPTLFTYPNYEGFRKLIFNKYDFVKGFVMNASEFNDVKSWPLTFSILSVKK